MASGDCYRVFYRSRDKAERLYLLRSMLAPRVSARWTEFIQRFYRHVSASGPPARVLAKPLRSYLHRGLGPRQRLNLLVEHYRHVEQNFSRDWVRALCAGEPFALAIFDGRKSTHFTLSIAASVTSLTQREGELVIYLAKNGDDLKLSRVSLCFAAINGARALVIGGIQGPQGGKKRQVIDATRELYGLRPKDAVFLAARAFAQAVGADSVHAVSDANHVLNRLQDVAKFSGYDDYWRERGGVAGGPFGFVFAPLEGAEPGVKGRDQLKAAIVAAMQGFVAAHGRRTATGRALASFGAFAPA